MSADGDSSLPAARVERARRASWTRLLPLLAVLLAALLVREAWRERGPLVVVHAAEGHGLRAGDPLRFRGIEVGRVETLALAARADEVVLEVRLERSAASLARRGTRFWIARPVLGVEGVRGLETALGARYLAVLPGPAEAEPSAEFVALEEPPLGEAEDPGALEVVLLADERSGLARGAPLTYRGIPIGSLVSVGLAKDARAVEVHARIQAPYAELVRADSRFYRTRGAELSLGLGGLALAVDSLQSLWLGGVGLATPSHAGARAVTGQRFELAARAEEEWLAWRPALPVGSAWPSEAAAQPERLWARLSFEPRGWFARAQARSGWLVRERGTLLGPEDLLSAPADAKVESVVLELGGERIPLPGPPSWSAAGLARRSLPNPEAEPGHAGFAPDSRRALQSGEDLLLWADPLQAPMAVAAELVSDDAAGASVSPQLTFDERWHGALVQARGDGRWVGLLLVSAGRGRIAPLPND